QAGTWSGSPIARVPLPISCDVLPAREGSDAFPSMETTRLHHAARRRGGVAARGARAAVTEAADHRDPRARELSIPWSIRQRFCAAIAATRLARRQQCNG